MSPIILVEFVGGPRCGARDKVRLGNDGAPPAMIGERYAVSDQDLQSGALAYAYNYPGGVSVLTP